MSMLPLSVAIGRGLKLLGINWNTFSNWISKMWDAETILGALTPKFYVVVTGTSSLISGLILFFEWWYFRKYGTSFIERASLTHLNHLRVGISDGPPPSDSPSQSPPAAPPDCKVWRNPLALLRGAEYGRLWGAACRPPLTYYDMNLSAQEHQAWFGRAPSDDDGAAASGDAADEAMAMAWRERSTGARVAAARAALAARPDCASALLLLAEEDAPTVLEAERVLRRAWRAADAAHRAACAGPGGAHGPEARRANAVLAHIKRRAAMCARRLGRLRDAVRLFRELARDAPPALHAMSLHENLIEALLEQRAYADVQAVIVRCEDVGLGASATVLYTNALLRARAAALQAGANGGGSRALDAMALDALRCAIEYNPHVPPYLLELRAVALPPEHMVRRGDSEALAYAFWHLRHWRAADGALKLANTAWAAWERAAWAAYRAQPQCQRCADLELLPPRAPAPPALRWLRSSLALPLALVCVGLVLLLVVLHKLALPPSLQPHALLRLLADI